MNIQAQKRRRKRKNTRIAIFFTLSIVSLISLCALIVSLFFYFKQKKETAAAMTQLAEMEQELFTEEELAASVQQERQNILDKMQSMMEDGQGILSLLQYFYPEKIIVSGNGRYYFFPILEHLEKNNLLADNFAYPIKNEESGKYEGEVTYKLEENTYAKKGIDVSSFQGDIDWSKVKRDGVDYAFLRLGFRGYESGKIVLDKNYEDNIKGSTEAGIDTGVYFFTEALTEAEAVEEAEFVLENLKDYKLTMPIVLDVEESASVENSRTKDLTKEQRTRNVIAFCERIKEAGHETMIYGNLKSFMLMTDIEKLEEYDKWFAYFRYPFHFPYKIKVWQHTASGTVDGIKGNVDMNLMFY